MISTDPCSSQPVTSFTAMIVYVPAFALESVVPLAIGVLVSVLLNQVKLYPVLVCVPSVSSTIAVASPSGVTQSVRGLTSVPSTVKLAGTSSMMVLVKVSE